MTVVSKQRREKLWDVIRNAGIAREEFDQMGLEEIEEIASALDVINLEDTAARNVETKISRDEQRANALNNLLTDELYKTHATRGLKNSLVDFESLLSDAQSQMLSMCERLDL